LRLSCRVVSQLIDSHLLLHLNLTLTVPWILTHYRSGDLAVLARRFKNLQALFLRPDSATDFQKRVDAETCLCVLTPWPSSLRAFHLSGWPLPYQLRFCCSLPYWAPALTTLVLEGPAPGAHEGAALAELPSLRRLAVRFGPLYGLKLPYTCPYLGALTQLTALQLAGAVPNQATVSSLSPLTGLRHLHLELLHDGYDKGMQVLDLRGHSCLSSLVLPIRRVLQCLPASLESLAVDLPWWGPGAVAPPPPPPPSAALAVAAAAAAAAGSFQPAIRFLACPPNLVSCLLGLGIDMASLVGLRLCAVPSVTASNGCCCGGGGVQPLAPLRRPLLQWVVPAPAPPPVRLKAAPAVLMALTALFPQRDLAPAALAASLASAAGDAVRHLALFDLDLSYSSHLKRDPCSYQSYEAESLAAATAAARLVQGPVHLPSVETAPLPREFSCAAPTDGESSKEEEEEGEEGGEEEGEFPGATIAASAAAAAGAGGRTMAESSQADPRAAAISSLRGDPRSELELFPMAPVTSMAAAATSLRFVAACCRLRQLRSLTLQPVRNLLCALRLLAGHPTLRVLCLLCVEEDGAHATDRPLLPRLRALVLALGGNGGGDPWVSRGRIGGGGGVEATALGEGDGGRDNDPRISGGSVDSGVMEKGPLLSDPWVGDRARSKPEVAIAAAPAAASRAPSGRQGGEGPWLGSRGVVVVVPQLAAWEVEEVTFTELAFADTSSLTLGYHARMTAQLQTFAASVLGLELDYVTPDIQGLSGWVAGARPSTTHPVIAHFRAPRDSENAAPILAALQPRSLPPEHNEYVSLAQYLHEIPAELLADDTAPRSAHSRAPSHRHTTSAAAATPPPAPSACTTCHALPAYNPSHPNLAVLYDVIQDRAALVTTRAAPETLQETADNESATATASPLPPPAPEPPPLRLAPTQPLPLGVATVGASWYPGCSLADCLRFPAAAASCGLLPGGGGRVGGGGGGSSGGPPGGDQHLRFLLLQLVAAVCHLHSHGYDLGGGGGITTATVLLQPGGWLQLLPPPMPPQPLSQQQQPQQQSIGKQQQQVAAPPPIPLLPACLRRPLPTLPALTRAWQHHALSTLDYLMLVNLLAGRRLGDRTFHPFVPWVTDFSVPPQEMLAAAAAAIGGSGWSCGGSSRGGSGSGGASGGGASGGGGGGWHDLTRSRYRQAKGDLQLDVTFSSSEVPHHIPQEPLSELSFCIYMARVTPRAVLQRAVRSHFEPREYPPSLETMLARTPDECLPQLYTDPGIFSSIHPELPDLQLPEWASSPQEFIRWHRALLESDHVSRHLHHWLDLFFGYKLVGAAAVAAKNVYLTNTQPQTAAAAGPAAAAASGPAAAAMAWSTAVAEGSAASSLLPYAPVGMHPPLFLSPHPPRLPSPHPPAPAAAAGPAAARTGTCGGGGGGSVSTHRHHRRGRLPSGDLVHSTGNAGGGCRVGFGSGAGAAEGGGGGGGSIVSGIGAVLCQLDSLELLGAVAAREGGLGLHEDYFAPLMKPLPLPRRRPEPASPAAAAAHDLGACMELGFEEEPEEAEEGEEEGLTKGLVGSAAAVGGNTTASAAGGRTWGQQGGMAEESVLARKRQDCWAIGQVAVQLYLGRCCYGPQQHAGYWLRLADGLPAAAKRFVRLCFDPLTTSERLLSDPFFSPALHAAHELLCTTLYDGKAAAAFNSTPASLPPPPLLRVPERLSALAAVATVGTRLRPVLDLCLPHIIHLLWQAAAVCNSLGHGPAAVGGGGGSGCSTNANGYGAVAACFPQPPAATATAAATSTVTGEPTLATEVSSCVYDILMALLGLLPPDKVAAHVLPYVCACLASFIEQPLDGGGGGVGGPRQRRRQLALQHRLLSASLQTQLLGGSDLELYMQHVLPFLLAALLCGEEGSSSGTTAAAADSAAAASGPPSGSSGGDAAVGGVARALAVSTISDAAAAAVVALAARLPLPLVLERIVSPLLSYMTFGTSVPRLLAQLCAEMGGQLTARHVAPALLQLAVVPAPPPPPPQSVAPSRGVGRGSRSQQSYSSLRASGGTKSEFTSASASSAAAAGTSESAATVPPSPPPTEPWLQHQIYTSLSVLTAVMDLLPREYIPRVFLHGLAPSWVLGPASPSTHGSPAASPGVADAAPLPPPPLNPMSAAASPRTSITAAADGVPSLVNCFLYPLSYRVAPGSLTMLAGLALRAFARLARPENVAWVVLPHLTPLLSYASAARRASYRANGTTRYWGGSDVAHIHDQGLPAVAMAQYGGSAGAAAAAAAAAAIASQGNGSNASWTLHRSRSSPSGEGVGGVAGGGIGSGGSTAAAAQGACDDEDGYWELVHCVYGHLVDSSGLLTVRNLLPGWQIVEAGLSRRLGWSPAAAGLWGVGGLDSGLGGSSTAAGSAGSAESAAGSCGETTAGTAEGGGGGGGGGGAAAAGSGGGGGGSSRRSALSALEMQVRQEIASKQQRLAAIHGTHLFIKEVGWSAPTSLATAVPPRSSPKDVPYAVNGGIGGGQGALSAAGGAGGGSTAAAAVGGGGYHFALGGGYGFGPHGVGRDVCGPEEGFVWPQLLAIGSPTVVEGLAVQGGGAAAGMGVTGGSGTGGALLGRQASLGGALVSITPNGARRTGSGGSGGGAAGSGGGRNTTVPLGTVAAAGARAARGPGIGKEAAAPRREVDSRTHGVGPSSSSSPAVSSCGGGGRGRSARVDDLGTAAEQEQAKAAGPAGQHVGEAAAAAVDSLSIAKSDSSNTTASNFLRRRSDRDSTPIQDAFSEGDDLAAASVVAPVGAPATPTSTATTSSVNAPGKEMKQSCDSGSAVTSPVTALTRHAGSVVASGHSSAAVEAMAEGSKPQLLPPPPAVAVVADTEVVSGREGEGPRESPSTGAVPARTGRVSNVKRPPVQTELMTASSDSPLYPPPATERSPEELSPPPQPQPPPPLQLGRLAGVDGSGSAVEVLGATATAAAAALPPSPFPSSAAPDVLTAPPPSPPVEPLPPPPPPAQHHLGSGTSTASPQQPPLASEAGCSAAGRSAGRRGNGAAAGHSLSPLLIPPPVVSDSQVPDTGSQRWHWLPPLTSAANAVHTAAAAAACGASSGSSCRAGSRARLLAAAAAPPAAGDVWSLQAAVVHSWPAHRDRIRALAAHPGECAVLTAGRGMVAGREGPVVRVWSLADCQARVQYGGHRAAVHALLLIRAARAGGAVVASLDAAAQLHVWAYDTGQQLACFAPVGGTGAGGGLASGGGGGVGNAAGSGSAAAAAVGETPVPSDSSPEVSLSSSAWGELIDRSGHYYMSSQGLEPRGWQSLGGLKTSRQLSASAVAAAAATEASSGPGAGAGSGGGSGGGIQGLSSGAATQLGAVPAATASPPTPGLAATAVTAGQAGAGALRLGFTTMCCAPEEHRVLYAGTADARVCALDLECRRVVAEWLAAPAIRHDSEDAVTALCTPGGGADTAAATFGAGWPAAHPEVVAAGSRAGRVVVLDRRCGTAAAAFRAHGGEVTSLASSGDFTLITAGADKQLRLWDLRRCAALGSGGGGGSAGASTWTTCTTGSGYDSRTGPWSGWQGPRGCGGAGGAAAEPFRGILDAMSPVAVGAAVSGGDGLYGGGMAPGGALDVTFPTQALAPGAAAAVASSMLTGVAGPPQLQLQQHPQQHVAWLGVAAPALLRSYPLPRECVQGLRVLRDCVLMTSGSSIGVMALPGEAAAAGGGGGGPSFVRLRNGRGGRESAAVTGLAVLPCSRLLVVAGDDGALPQLQQHLEAEVEREHLSYLQDFARPPCSHSHKAYIRLKHQESEPVDIGLLARGVRFDLEPRPAIFRIRYLVVVQLDPELEQLPRPTSFVTASSQGANIRLPLFEYADLCASPRSDMME
ncbi:hypothetical protein VOLCADRAFT_93838, partial [Volvox carteri f. nagariensis]